MGDLLQLTKGPLPFDQLAKNTRLTYADVDAGPTKAFMILNKDKPEFKFHWDLGFGARPEEELYDLKKDPHQVINLAKDPAYEKQHTTLRSQLMAELEKYDDPRLRCDQFDRPPYCKIGLPGKK